jgi:WD40-like Beta Propeller Repeat
VTSDEQERVIATSSDGKRLALSAFLGDGQTAALGTRRQRGVPRTPVLARTNRLGHHQHRLSDFYHFATDIAGKRLISDSAPLNEGAKIYLAELGEPGKDPWRNFRYLLCPKSSCQKDAHIHPFLSPDGSLAFFNSDESGVLQAYMIRGLG